MLSHSYKTITPQSNMSTEPIICLKWYSSFQSRLNTIKPKSVCNKSNIAAVDGEEYLIPKKYNRDHIPRNKDEKKVGKRRSFCKYPLYDFWYTDIKIVKTRDNKVA